MNQDEGTSLQAILRRPRVEIDVEHYYAGVEIAYDGGVNLAFTGDAPSVPPRMVQHSLRMAQRIYRVAERVYCAVLDTTEKKEGAEAAREDFYRACPAARPLPFVAVIYSHNHTDHIGGVRAFASDESVASGACKIIAHETLMEAVTNNAVIAGPILTLRSAYSFGSLLEAGPEGRINNGIGPELRKGQTTFIAPTVT